ncbi:MAG TPA: hypothetical protein VJZ27_00115, partial [Aggregatilineales bacterium]|nr:hypothetical protein [Aggregatilineales bacterium]
TDLSLYQLWLILQSPGACTLADNFMNTGSLGAGPLPPPPGCFDLGGNQVLLDDGQVISGASAWTHKVAVLSRPSPAVCAGLVMAPGDTDGDGVTDDIDACPAEFALTPTGCPTNTPPTVDPIPDQSVATGGFINVGVVVNDADGDPVALGATSADTTIANVSVSGTVLTITGIAAGTTTITVSATDGTDITPVMFNVTVNTPPAPNNPPTINPIPPQVVQRGSSINVSFSAVDPDANPLTFSVAAADPTVVNVSLSGTNLTIMGIKAGGTPVTVIVNDGMASASSAFTVTVTPPPPPQPPVNNTGTGTGNNTPAQQQLIDSGVVTEEQLAFGLLGFPDGQNVDATAVFQADDTTGKSNIFMLAQEDITPLLNAEDGNHLFPSLDPTGKLIAFLTQDATGNVTLRILSIERGVSLTVFSSDATRQVGVFPVSWSPDGKSLLFTLVSNGLLSVYELQIGNPANIPEPKLVVQNATTASFAPNGRYFAFEQTDPNGNTSIFVGITGKPDSTHPVTEQPAGSRCFAPMFGTDSIALFFACEMNGERSLYRYDIQGLTKLEVGIAGAGNPAPGPGSGFIGFDDGAVIYYGFDDGSNVKPMLRLENQNASNLRWTTLTEFELDS